MMNSHAALRGWTSGAATSYSRNANGHHMALGRYADWVIGVHRWWYDMEQECEWSPTGWARNHL